MAAFKHHAAFGFWRHVEVMGGERPAEGMGSFGRPATHGDLPPKRTLAMLLKRAAALNASGTKPVRAAAKKAPAPLPEMPADFATVLVEPRREARRDPREAHRPGRRMAGRGQVAEREVREALSPCGKRSGRCGSVLVEPQEPEHLRPLFPRLEDDGHFPVSKG